MKKPTRTIARHKVFILFIIVLTVAVYSTTFQNEFLSDDIPGIVNNPSIGDLDTQLKTFSIQILYSLMYNAVGPVPFYYHVMSTLFHTASAVVVYIIISLITVGNSKWIARYGSVIFAVHPLATESVAWISALTYTAYVFFLLVSFLTFVLVEKNYAHKVWLVLGALFFWLALLSNFKAIILPALLLLYLAGYSEVTKKKLLLLVPATVVALAQAVVLPRALSVRIDQLNTTPGDTYFVNPFTEFAIAVSEYLKLFLVPYNLTHYHDFNDFVNFTKLDQAFSVVVLIVLFIVVLICYFVRKEVAFGLAFFFIAISPNVTLISNVSWLVAERYVYLGLFGLSLVASYLIVGYLNDKPEKYKWGALVLVILILVPLTIRRNLQWRTAESFYSSNLKVSPNSSHSHYFMAEVYSKQNNLEKTIEELELAIYYRPNYIAAMYELGKVYFQTGEREKAEELFKQIVLSDPQHYMSQKALAIIAFESNDFQTAEKYFTEASRYDPDPIGNYLSLFVIFVSRGDIARAEEALTQAKQLAGDNPQKQQMVQQAIQMVSAGGQ